MILMPGAPLVTMVCVYLSGRNPVVTRGAAVAPIILLRSDIYGTYDLHTAAYSSSRYRRLKYIGLDLYRAVPVIVNGSESPET